MNHPFGKVAGYSSSRCDRSCKTSREHERKAEKMTRLKQRNNQTQAARDRKRRVVPCRAGFCFRARSCCCPCCSSIEDGLAISRQGRKARCREIHATRLYETFQRILVRRVWGASEKDQSYQAVNSRVTEILVRTSTREESSPR